MYELSQKERAFFSWLKKELSQKQCENLKQSKNNISIMLMKRKLLRQPLLLNEDSQILLEILSKIPGCFANTKMRADAVQLVTMYISYLEQKEGLEQEDEKSSQVKNEDDTSTIEVIRKKSVDSTLVEAIEKIVREAADGINKVELFERFSQYDEKIYNAAILEADIISVLEKFYHKDNIEDFDFMADVLDEAIRRQFLYDGGYTSAFELYKEVAPKLDDFFFYNGAFESRAEVYDLATYLFEKKGYKGHKYVFKKKIHIWEHKPDYPMEYGGLLIKYGRERGNVFSRDEAIAYLEKHGSGTPHQTVSYILNKSGKEFFLQYDENQFVLAEAINIDSQFKEKLQTQIEVLLDGEDYVALGDINDYFYSTLPDIPANVIWGPLLLESILEHYEMGFKTIDAGESNDMKTIDAALLKKNSVFKNFADIVWNELKKDFELPRTFSSEEFRVYLLNKGFLRGMERINSVHKTVANDLRFYWTDSYSAVTVSNS